MKAWIEQTPTGRFFVIEESTSIFKGYQNRVYAFWKNKQSARNYCKRNGREIQPGKCPLPKVTEEMRARYRETGSAF